MCGLSGIIALNSASPQLDSLKKMNDLIHHRGPDGEGFYISEMVALGHRRLAIIDLSTSSDQPMHFEDKQVIIFNGEIFNYIELRDELKSLGHKFKTKGDTEVILAAYNQWGEGCVNKFNGMWAFALYDIERDKVFCSRDRFGVKPFYYVKNHDFFKFGSEIKQLLPDSPILNEETLAKYLFSGSVDSNQETFFQGVFKLAAGHNLIIDLKEKNFKICKYYNFEDSSLVSSVSAENIIDSSISLRLRSDVKVGSCLSGGIDSTIVAVKASHLYQKENPEKFIAVHAKSLEPALDESHLAALASEQGPINLTIIEPTSANFFSALKDVVYTQEEPFSSPSIFLQYFVMKKARELGCKVMLDGQGGDEVFLGYDRYLIPAIYNFLRTKGIKEAITQFKLARKNNKGITLKNFAIFSLESLLKPFINLYAKKRNKLLRPCIFPKNFDYLLGSTIDLVSIQKEEIKKTTLPPLLRYEDKNSMKFSIEARLPYLDFRVVEKALSLPVDKKVKDGWTKITLRNINAIIVSPKIAWNTKKLGFNAPDKTWIQDNKDELLSYIKNSQILNKYTYTDRIIERFDSLPTQTAWRFINIGIWEKVYNVSIE